MSNGLYKWFIQIQMLAKCFHIFGRFLKKKLYTNSSFH